MIGDGYRAKRSQFSTSGIPFVRGGDIKDGRINTDVTDHVRKEFLSELKPKLTEPGDVAFITKGNVGRVGRLGQDQPVAVFAPQVCFWRSRDKEQLDPGYLFFLLNSRWFQVQLDSTKTSGSMAADYVSLRDQNHFLVPIPHISEQRRIADVLGALDDKIELNRQMNQTLESMARAIFESWFVRFDGHEDFEDSELGPIPRGWHIQRLAEHLEVEKGLSYKGKHLVEDGVPLVNLNSILEGGGWKASGLKFYDGPYKERHQLEPGDVVVANTEQGHKYLLIGCPAIIPRRVGAKAIYSHHLFRIRPLPSSQIGSEFIYHFLANTRTRQKVTAFTNGTTVNGLARDGLAKPWFCVPPAELVQQFEAIASSIRERAELNQQQSQTLAELRDTLLPKLISGEIRVPAAEEAVAGVV